MTFIDDNLSEQEVVIEEVKRELKRLCVKIDELIKKLGNALKKVVKKEEGICEEIKIALKEEIAEGVISTRTIELHCPPEWKRKTKPKNEKISFSREVEEKPQQQIAATQEGNSVIINETSSNTEAYPIPSDGVNQPHTQSKQKAMLTHSLNDEIASVIKQTEDLPDTKQEVLVSHIPMPFEDLRKDMATVFQTTKGMGNIFFKIWVDLRLGEVKIEFCGITQQKDVAMASTGKGILKEA